MSTAIARLRDALLACAREVELAPEALCVVGRPLWSHEALGMPLVSAPLLSTQGPLTAVLTWGPPRRDDREALVHVPLGAVAAWVFPAARAGARGVLDRAMLLASGHRPAPIEDVCTALFVAGVRAQRVIALESRRNVVAVIGRRVHA